MFEKIAKNCRYGFVWVSSKSQEDNSLLESQIDQGVSEKNIRAEVGSTTDPIRERPVFHNRVKKDLKENDLLLDRSSRNTLDFFKF